MFHVDNDYLKPWLAKRELPIIDAHVKHMFEFSAEGSTTLQEHTHLAANLAPNQHRNFSYSARNVDGQDDLQGSENFNDFQRAMAERRTKDRLASDVEWNKVLSDLGYRSAKTSPTSDSDAVMLPNGARDLSTAQHDERGAISDAVDDLLSTLRRLDSGRRRGSRMVTIISEDGEEEHLDMTSTLRKRKKKIKKHKYKKRRKVSEQVHTCDVHRLAWNIVEWVDVMRPSIADALFS